MPEHYRFFTPIQVRYAETDAQGHVFFGNYLTYFDVAVTEYLKAIHYPYEKLLEQGLDFYYVETLCQYKDRAYFDEVLHVHARIGRVGNTSFTYEFAVWESSADRFVCRGHIVAVVVDRDRRRPVPVPEGLRRAVASFEGGT
jgi:acyl-CoA thioester hydrolase